MRRVRSYVRKKRGLVFAFRFDPFQRLCEKQIRAVSFSFLKGAVVAERWVEVAIPGSVSTAAFVTLSNATRAMNVNFIKSAVSRLIRILVPQMPLAKNAGSVSYG